MAEGHAECLDAALDGRYRIEPKDVRGEGLDEGGAEPEQLIVVENVFEELRGRGGGQHP